MSAFASVVRSYRHAWAHAGLFIGIFFILQALALALIVPLAGAMVNFAVSLSSQSALTDQDIARFLLSPLGFVAAVVVLSLLIIAQVLGFAVMSAVYRVPQGGVFQVAFRAMKAVASRGQALFLFAAVLVLRILVIVLPFAAIAGLIALKFLSEYDINYYLSLRPPEAVVAAIAIGLVVIVMALVLLFKLSGWAVALHLVMFGECGPFAAFRESTKRVQGRRFRLQVELVVWFLVRLGLLAALAVLATALINLIPVPTEGGLRFALLMTVLGGAVWAICAAAISALALAALAWLLGVFYDGGQMLPETTGKTALISRRNVTVALIAITGLAGVGFWTGARVLDGLQTEDSVEIIAHRGAAGSRPENTLASVVKALDDKTDWVEIDVQETSDGQIAVVHDSDFMKLAGDPRKVWDVSVDDLSEIDIGSWFAPEYSDQRPPMLRDVLELAKDRAKVVIELKYYGHDVDLENRVARVVEGMNMADQVAIMSLKYPAVQKMQKLRPGWRTGVLAATAVGDLSGLDADFIAVNAGIAGPRLVSSMHDAGKDLYVWTVNDPLEMSKMMSMGVDGLITDEPALAREVIRIRAGLSTPERLVLWMSEELGLQFDTRQYRDNEP